MVVVSKIRIKDSNGTDTTKVSYRHGLIKTVRSKYQDMSFTYKKNKIKKLSINIKTGPLKGQEISSYVWKNNHIIQKNTEDNIATEKSLYNWKNGKCISSFSKYLDFDDTGTIRKYTYKKGVVCKEKLSYIGIADNTVKYKFDKKRNLKSVTVIYPGGKLKTYHAKLSYKNGKLVKIQAKEYDPFSDKPSSKTIYIQYKKIKINPSKYKIIKEQQWQLINSNATAFAW